MLKQKEMDSHLDLNRKMNVAHINLCTEAEGPYKRMAIWFQGCNILCEECCNPELQPIKTANIMTIQEIVNVAIESRKLYGIEGITLLGGEPTMQESLPVLVRELNMHDFGIILFTGKSIELVEQEVLSNVDLIVDGKFDKTQIDEKRNLIGSKNQNIHRITNRYEHDMDWFYVTRDKIVEINFNQNTNFLITGDVLQ